MKKQWTPTVIVEWCDTKHSIPLEARLVSYETHRPIKTSIYLGIDQMDSEGYRLTTVEMHTVVRRLERGSRTQWRMIFINIKKPGPVILNHMLHHGPFWSLKLFQVHVTHLHINVNTQENEID